MEKVSIKRIALLNVKLFGEKCGRCGRKFDDADNVEAIKELGSCLGCDHIGLEVLEQHK